MLMLTIRTDKPEAEIGLYSGDTQLAYETWQAHRQLAETLHLKIHALLQSHGKTLQDLEGIACFQGPGSFTGLRIGLTVANALAYSLQIPIVATADADPAQPDDPQAAPTQIDNTRPGNSQPIWLTISIARLRAGDSDVVAVPEYGSDVHITQPRCGTNV